MVQLRVDVEAANARREFDAAARSVENLADELDDAEDEATRLRSAFNQAAAATNQLEARVQATDRRLEELRSTVRAMGNAMPSDLRDELRRTEQQSRDLRRQLDRTAAGTLQLGQAANRAEDNVARLGDELDDARREAQRLQRALDQLDADAGRVGNTIRRGLAGFQQQAADVFRGGFSALPAEAKAAAAAAAVAIGAAVASAVGAAINAALLAAVGGGVLAAAVALAAKQSNIVQQAWAGALRPMQEDVSNFALMFEDELVGAARMFRDAWADSGDATRRIFGSMIDEVEPLAAGLLRLAKNALPGVEKAAEAAGPVLQQLAEDLPELGDAISDMFESFASGGDGAVKGMRAIVMGLAFALNALGETVEFLSKQWDSITEKGAALTAWAAKIPGLGSAMQPFADFWAKLNGDLGGSVKVMEGVTLAADGTSTAMSRQADAAQRAAQQALLLSQRLSQLISDQMGAQQAAIAWEAAIDAVTDAAKENGRTLDIGTEKGRANAQTILSAVAAAEQKRQADIAMAGGQKASAAAVEAANQTFRNQIAQLEALLLSLGFTKAQVDSLLGAYRNLAAAPNINKTITIRTVGDARAAIASGNAVRAGNIVGYASGVQSARPGWALVGEQGPELMRMRGGEQVWTARETAAMMSGASGGAYRPMGGGTTYSITVVVPPMANPADAGRATVEAIKAYEQTSGSGWRR